ncbi:MAG: TM2 domain-containing protein [Duncaniella sp.]|uniref:TM2 domain-containing protein n=1 Tax=Duncaniella sp. TaxID=2518496 RepID=UPI0023D70985|nr:TM2 domain-containing protein [Duncaniella sp.]MDE5989385.1 TM2 domain-containing protein [Duncaniella sp.]
MKSKTTAGVLGILLGAFGANYFYLGKPGKGIACVLTCWSGVPGLIGLVKGIQYLTMDETTFQSKYGSN